jgi:hypothetical protein
MSCIESCLIALTVVTCENIPSTIASEDLVDNILSSIRHHLEKNVFPYFEAQEAEELGNLILQLCL